MTNYKLFGAKNFHPECVTHNRGLSKSVHRQSPPPQRAVNAVEDSITKTSLEEFINFPLSAKNSVGLNNSSINWFD